MDNLTPLSWPLVWSTYHRLMAVCALAFMVVFLSMDEPDALTVCNRVFCLFQSIAMTHTAFVVRDQWKAMMMTSTNITSAAVTQMWIGFSTKITMVLIYLYLLLSPSLVDDMDESSWRRWVLTGLVLYHLWHFIFFETSAPYLLSLETFRRPSMKTSCGNTSYCTVFTTEGSTDTWINLKPNEYDVAHLYGAAATDSDNRAERISSNIIVPPASTASVVIANTTTDDKLKAAYDRINRLEKHLIRDQAHTDKVLSERNKFELDNQELQRELQLQRNRHEQDLHNKDADVEEFQDKAYAEIKPLNEVNAALRLEAESLKIPTKVQPQYRRAVHSDTSDTIATLQTQLDAANTKIKELEVGEKEAQAKIRRLNDCIKDNNQELRRLRDAVQSNGSKKEQDQIKAQLGKVQAELVIQKENANALKTELQCTKTELHSTQTELKSTRHFSNGTQNKLTAKTHELRLEQQRASTLDTALISAHANTASQQNLVEQLTEKISSLQGKLKAAEAANVKVEAGNVKTSKGLEAKEAEFTDLRNDNLAKDVKTSDLGWQTQEMKDTQGAPKISAVATPLSSALAAPLAPVASVPPHLVVATPLPPVIGAQQTAASSADTEMSDDVEAADESKEEKMTDASAAPSLSWSDNDAGLRSRNLFFFGFTGAKQTSNNQALTQPPSTTFHGFGQTSNKAGTKPTAPFTLFKLGQTNEQDSAQSPRATIFSSEQTSDGQASYGLEQSNAQALTQSTASPSQMSRLGQTSGQASTQAPLAALVGSWQTTNDQVLTRSTAPNALFGFGQTTGQTSKHSVAPFNFGQTNDQTSTQSPSTTFAGLGQIFNSQALMQPTDLFAPVSGSEETSKPQASTLVPTGALNVRQASKSMFGQSTYNQQPANAIVASSAAKQNTNIIPFGQGSTVPAMDWSSSLTLQTFSGQTSTAIAAPSSTGAEFNEPTQERKIKGIKSVQFRLPPESEPDKAETSPTIRTIVSTPAKSKSTLKRPGIVATEEAAKDTMDVDNKWETSFIEVQPGKKTLSYTLQGEQDHSNRDTKMFDSTGTPTGFGTQPTSSSKESVAWPTANGDAPASPIPSLPDDMSPPPSPTPNIGGLPSTPVPLLPKATSSMISPAIPSLPNSLPALSLNKVTPPYNKTPPKIALSELPDELWNNNYEGFILAERLTAKNWRGSDQELEKFGDYVNEWLQFADDKGKQGAVAGDIPNLRKQLKTINKSKLLTVYLAKGRVIEAIWKMYSVELDGSVLQIISGLCLTDHAQLNVEACTALTIFKDFLNWLFGAEHSECDHLEFVLFTKIHASISFLQHLRPAFNEVILEKPEVKPLWVQIQAQLVEVKAKKDWVASGRLIRWYSGASAEEALKNWEHLSVELANMVYEFQTWASLEDKPLLVGRMRIATRDALLMGWDWQHVPVQVRRRVKEMLWKLVDNLPVGENVARTVHDDLKVMWHNFSNAMEELAKRTGTDHA